MSNGMPNWDEWNGLTQEQRDYSLYKVLSDLYHRECTRDTSCETRLRACLELFQTNDDEIKALKSRKHFDTSMAGAFGFIGGAAAWIIKWTIGK